MKASLQRCEINVDDQLGMKWFLIVGDESTAVAVHQLQKGQRVAVVICINARGDFELEAMFHSGDKDIKLEVAPGIDANHYRNALALLQLVNGSTSALVTDDQKPLHAELLVRHQAVPSDHPRLLG